MAESPQIDILSEINTKPHLLVFEHAGKQLPPGTDEQADDPIDLQYCVLLFTKPVVRIKQ